MNPIWVKISDFGISKLIRNNESALRTSQIGTQGFQAPEMLRLLDDAAETSEYTTAVDLWSLGCVLYFLICRKLPFPGGQLWPYCLGHADFPRSFLQSLGVGIVGMDFLKGLLTPTPTERPTASSALQSTWILEPDMVENEDVTVSSTQTHRILKRELQSVAAEVDHLAEKTILANPPLKTTLSNVTIKQRQPVANIRTMPEDKTFHAWTSPSFGMSLHKLIPFAVSSGKQPEDENIRVRRRQEVQSQPTKNSDENRANHGQQRKLREEVLETTGPAVVEKQASSRGHPTLEMSLEDKNGPGFDPRRSSMGFQSLPDHHSFPSNSMPPIGYVGYIFTKQPVENMGQRETWAMVNRELMPASQADLKNQVEKLRKRGVTGLDQYNDLDMKGYKRMQVDDLIQDVPAWTSTIGSNTSLPPSDATQGDDKAASRLQTWKSS